MFWHLTSLSASSPVESILDKDIFTLEELLDEEDIIQECKALNSRLINFLRDRAQVEQLLRYITEEPQEDADSKRIFKFPFIACEIFTCEIDVIFKTLVEEEELMNLLFSFLEPTRSHSALLAGYFSKVVICLMLRKTVPLINYVQVHQYIFQQLVDLIGVTSIMEVLVRLVGSDDHMYPDSVDVVQWLTESNLLEMIVDKLSPSSTPEVHANAAETLCAITRNISSSLASKLSTPSFVSRIFGHLLDDSHSKSGLVSSLSVCISLLDPKRSIPTPFYSFRGQHMYESPVQVNQETVGAMLPKLGDLLMLLNVSLDEKILPTTYGQLRPPLGKHRLKIVEFISVLLKTGNEIAEKELISSGTIQRVLDLFFEYPYNNALHHHIESIIYSCLESTNNTIIDHLLQACGLLAKILQTDNNPVLSGELNLPTLPAAGRNAPRLGNLGHITRIANKILQLANTDSRIQAHIQERSEWNEWQATALQDRNMVENVYRWACGRPTSLHDRNRGSDIDDIHHDRDYDVSALANNLSQAFRYNVYDNEEGEEGHESLGRGDEMQEGYFDDESAEVVISSLRLGDDQGSLFTNSNWFAFQDDKMGDATMTATSPSEMMDRINLKESSTIDNTGNDDDVVVGVDEEFLDSKLSNSITNRSPNPFSEEYEANGRTSASDADFFRFESTDNEDLFADKPMPEWVGWGEPVGGSGLNPFEDDINIPTVDIPSAPETPVGVGLSVSPGSVSLPNGSSSDGSVASSDTSQKDGAVPSLFEEDVEFVGVELDGSEKAMDKALKEGIVGEAGALKRKVTPSGGENENDNDNDNEAKEFNDSNYWRVDQEIAVSE